METSSVVRDGSRFANQADTRLRSIADLLGCNVSAFAAGGSDSIRALAQANELVSFWQAIPDPADRERVLELARRLAAR